MSILLASAFFYVLFAVAFGLVAVRCRATERAVSSTAWLTCAAMLLGAALHVAAPFVPSRIASHIVYSLTALSYFAFVAFGMAARRTFGSWFGPASICGVVGALGYFCHLFFASYVFTTAWLIPLLILGIEMCRTHVRPQATA